MNQAQRSEMADLGAYIDASPSPYHACQTAAKRLADAGFRLLDEAEDWPREAGAYYTLRAGSLIAWISPPQQAVDAGFRLIGAHTDSPNLRIKPRPNRSSYGIDQLGVEVYGGVLLNSWLDRDLGLSGRVWIDRDGVSETRLFHWNEALLRVPQLAIHLHREIHADGLKLNKQKHMVPIFGMSGGMRRFQPYLEERLDLQGGNVMHWDAMVHDLTPSTLAGAGEEFFFAPRLDNLCSVWAGLRAIERVASQGVEQARDAAASGGPTAMVAFFDHEEVGSASRSGAQGSYLRDTVERVVTARGGDREAYHRSIAQSFCVSSDMAHATHPNYPEKHDPEHPVLINEGVVIKLNANQRYASEGDSVARFEMACRKGNVPYQKWVMRSDLACGSTIGPITASGLGITTVDVGGPQLSMHSAREMCGSQDPPAMADAFEVILQGQV